MKKNTIFTTRIRNLNGEVKMTMKGNILGYELIISKNNKPYNYYEFDNEAAAYAKYYTCLIEGEGLSTN